MHKAIKIAFIIIGIALCAQCRKIETLKPKESANLANVNTNIGVNQIVNIPENAHKVITKNFTRYTKLSSTSGDPIHILIQEEIEDKTIIKIRETLKAFLNAVNESKYSVEKLLISDKIAENGGCITIFKNQLEIENTTSELNEVDLNFTHISASDIVFEDSEDYRLNSAIDFSYGKIAAFILQLGIKDVLPSYYTEIKDAALNAVESNYWLSLSIPEWRSDEDELTNQYFAVITGIYYDLWAHTTSGLGGDSKFRFNSRQALQFGDNNGYKAILDFFPAQLEAEVILTLPEDSLFTLTHTAQYLYSLKSQHLVNITLQGDNDMDIVANKYDNVLVGNDGINTYRVSGLYGEYIISRQGGTTTLTDTVSNRNGKDVVEFFEHIQFSDTLIDVL
jgi:hypothetical protein